MDDEQLLQQVIAALALAIEQYQADSPTNPLAGVALLTDDGVSTLYAAAVGKDDLSGSADPDLLYTPTDWPHEHALSAFKQAERELHRRYDACPDLGRHVDNSFALLVRALSAIRCEAIVGESVLLTALSSDPCNHLVALETDAVARLNPIGLVDGWRAFLEKWRR